MDLAPKAPALPMTRAFLPLALLDAALLLAAAIVGAMGAGWQALHGRLGLVAMIATLAVHGLVYGYFLGTRRWVESVSTTKSGIPSWAADLADRNLRRVVPFLVVSGLLLAATAGTPAGLLHLAAATAAIAFTLGTFALSYLAIVNQAQLIAEINNRLSTPSRPDPTPQ